MKKFTSIKARITIWYTALMLVIISVVMIVVGALSYHLSMNNIEATVKAQVVQVADKFKSRGDRSIAFNIENNEEFKGVSIYRNDGEYIVGQYDYDISKIPFQNEFLRKEGINGESYIIYDVFKPGPPGRNEGYWIRGAESVAYTKVLGRSLFIIILIVIPFILFLTALGGYYITKKAFRPVDNMVKTANEICFSKDIEKRMPIDEKSRDDEFYRLSVTLNRMLDRIEDLIIREKQFTSDASHELRTPISVILAQGEYLLDISESEKEKELAQDIVTKANQVSKLVSRLLLLARIDGKRQKFNKEKIDINALIDIAAENVSELARSRNIKILTQTDCQSMIYADEVLLMSAVTNLISNGIKYGKDSGYVMISASEIGDNVEIIIKDNGIGIAKEHLDKIWTRFFRVDDVRNDEYGSSGLGLPMVKSIIELHGGEIYVNSRLGQGTEFKIVLKRDI